MKIESLNENRFYILLSDEDMKELGISFEELDYSNIETRRVIWTLLEEARNTLRRDIDPRSKMLIEVSRGAAGCKIEFTLSKNDTSGRLKIKKESGELSALFNDFSSLCAFIEKSKGIKDEITSAELYKNDDGYSLILLPKNEYRMKIRLNLGEYAVLLPDSPVGSHYLREHGKLIYRGSFPKPAP